MFGCCCNPLTEGPCAGVVTKICVHEQQGHVFGCALYRTMTTSRTRISDGAVHNSIVTYTAPNNTLITASSGDASVLSEINAIPPGSRLVHPISPTSYSVEWPGVGLYTVSHSFNDLFTDAAMSQLLDALEAAADFGNAAGRFVHYLSSGIIQQTGTLGGSQVINIHWRSICAHSLQCGTGNVSPSTGQIFGATYTPVVVSGANGSITLGFSGAGGTQWGASRILSRVTLSANYRVRTYELSPIAVPLCPPKLSHQCRHNCTPVDAVDFSDGLDAGGQPRTVVFDRLSLPPSAPHFYQTVTCLT